MVLKNLGSLKFEGFLKPGLELYHMDQFSANALFVANIYKLK